MMSYIFLIMRIVVIQNRKRGFVLTTRLTISRNCRLKASCPLYMYRLSVVIFRQANYAHPGYVAVTPGAKHVAPLPYAGASHHVNLAKAPGTK